MDKIKKRVFSLSLLLIAVTALSIYAASWWLIKTHHNNVMTSQIALANDYISEHFNSREKNIVLAAELITKDYGFREAIATRDNPTIQSMLENHAARVTADYFVITTNAGEPLASQKLSALPLPLNKNLLNLLSHSQKTAFITVDDSLFRVVVLPVLAPRDIGHAVIGYQITPQVLNRLKRKTGIDLHFYSRSAEKLLLSTNPRAWQGQGNRDDFSSQPAANQDFLRQADFGLSDPVPEIELYLQADTSTFDKSLNQLHFQMLLISAFAVLLASLMSSSLAKRLADPLSALYQELTHRANHDYLTGIANRHNAIKQINAALSRVCRTKQPYYVCICDIDDFKFINDKYGHTVGDQVLKEITLRLNTAMRDTDILGRFGGEEFLIAMEVSTDSAFEAFERLRGLIDQRPIVSNQTEFPVTMSFGVCVIESPPAVIDIEQVIEKADAALYDAKRHGKNRVEIIEF